jgi:hypothetical protein
MYHAIKTSFVAVQLSGEIFGEIFDIFFINSDAEKG